LVATSIVDLDSQIGRCDKWTLLLPLAIQITQLRAAIQLRSSNKVMAEFRAPLPYLTLLPQPVVDKSIDDAMEELGVKRGDNEYAAKLAKHLIPEPTYGTISKKSIDELTSLCRSAPIFDRGWWSNVRVFYHNPTKEGLPGPTLISFPDVRESPLTLQYLGFRASAVWILWARYLSIVIGGYNPYNLWDFVRDCIIGQYPKDATPLEDRTAWGKVADGLRVHYKVKECLEQRSFPQVPFFEVERNCKECVLMLMKFRWKMLCHMEDYVSRRKISVGRILTQE